MAYYCPMPCRFGTIRIDPVASVQHLNDPIAEKEAQSLETKTYICYLYLERHLPFPDEPWYLFAVDLIGPRLRPADREQALTPDMSIPIFPNEDHPSGREPVRPEPAFPFKNCYFWYDVGLDVRIRAKPNCGLFDETHAICLPILERFLLSDHAAEDYHRQYARLRNRRKSKVALRQSTEHVGSESASLQDEQCANESNADVESFASDSYSDCSDYSKDSDATRSEVSLLTLDALANMNIFGYPDGVFKHPLVDFSFDLQEHLDEANIPDPLDMLAERNALLEIIGRARDRALKRQSILEESIAPTGSCHYEHNQLCAQTRCDEDTTANERRRSHRWGILRQLRLSPTVVVKRIKHAMRAPYLPIWP